MNSKLILLVSMLVALVAGIQRQQVAACGIPSREQARALNTKLLSYYPDLMTNPYGQGQQGQLPYGQGQQGQLPYGQGQLPYGQGQLPYGQQQLINPNQPIVQPGR